MNILTLELNDGYSTCYVYEHVKGTLYDLLENRLKINNYKSRNQENLDRTVVGNMFNSLADDYCRDEFEDEDADAVKQHFKKVSRPFEISRGGEMTYCYFAGNANAMHGWKIMQDGKWTAMDTLKEDKMKKTYTRKQIAEAIAYWERQLKLLDEGVQKQKYTIEVETWDVARRHGRHDHITNKDTNEVEVWATSREDAKKVLQTLLAKSTPKNCIRCKDGRRHVVHDIIGQPQIETFFSGFTDGISHN